jgi:putative SOS response-associated peptidase YedK
MCGRFSITKEAEDIAARFDAQLALAFKKVFNGAPGQNLPVLANAEPHVINLYRWGLVPFWAKDLSIGNRMINARAETITEKPAFRNLIKGKRCLVISDGFYEWKKTAELKQPYRITLKEEELYSYAGLWDIWKAPDESIINSFTIITTGANKLIGQIHDRMPVILHKEDENKWLNKDEDINKIVSLLKPFPENLMKMYPVSTLVNSTYNNSPDLLKKIDLN